MEKQLLFEFGGRRGTRTLNAFDHATCFQDKLLVQPDPFRIALGNREEKWASVTIEHSFLFANLGFAMVHKSKNDGK